MSTTDIAAFYADGHSEFEHMKTCLRTLLAALAVIIASGCEGETGAGGEQSTTTVPIGSGFDFYVLSLSWSPSYCASLGDRANRQQCDERQDYGFVVHGLWPQFERGYPSDCPTDWPLNVPRDLSDSMLDIMPATGLVRHQWRKHGTCTGLSQEAYFAVTRMALQRVTIPTALQTLPEYSRSDPDNVEEAFIEANPGLPAASIAVTCDRRFLREVRICLKKDLMEYAVCPEVDRNACKRPSAVMPPT
jgi:ribonuclease T2